MTPRKELFPVLSGWRAITVARAYGDIRDVSGHLDFPIPPVARRVRRIISNPILPPQFFGVACKRVFYIAAILYFVIARAVFEELVTHFSTAFPSARFRAFAEFCPHKASDKRPR